MTWSGRGTSRNLHGGISASLMTVFLGASLLISPAAAQPVTCDVMVSSIGTPGAGVIENVPATPNTLPLASPAATPVAVVDTLTAEITGTVEQLAACLSENEAEAVVQLASERYLGQLFGSSVPLSGDDFIALSQSISPTPVRIVAVEDVTRPAEDRATATVTQVVGNQLIAATWTFRPGSGATPWMLDREQWLPVTVPAGAEVIDVEIRRRSFELDPVTVAGTDVVLRGRNVDATDHEMLVLKLDTGFTTQDLLRASGPDLPPQAAYIGEVPVRAGQAQDLVLVDLEAGEYTIVCLFPDGDGVPHLAQGMAATFTVR